MRMGTHFSSMEPAGTTYILSLRTFSDIAATPPYSMLFSLGKRSRSSPENTYILVERGERRGLVRKRSEERVGIPGVML